MIVVVFYIYRCTLWVEGKVGGVGVLSNERLDEEALTFDQ